MLYNIFKYYADEYFQSCKHDTNITKVSSIVDFGTAMINKRKHKRNKNR